MEGDLYSNSSTYEDLESEFKKDSWRCSNKHKSFNLINMGTKIIAIIKMKMPKIKI
jgi:hypothetical protein